MRPRASGGLEPDDNEQIDLSNLWHLSLTALQPGTPTRGERVAWVVDAFCKATGASRKFVYVWCERYLGRLVDPDPVPVPDWMSDGPTSANTVPTKVASKKRAKTRRPR